MNLLLNGDLWGDSIAAPSIWWTGERYEILIDNEGSPDGVFRIFMNEPGVEGDRIAFSYEVSTWDPQSGQTEGFLNIIDQDNVVVHSVDFTSNPTGEVDFEVQAGVLYSIFVAYSNSSYSSGYFYDLEAILTPLPDVAPTPTVIPWWMCPPREPVEPCPVRPTTFVTFANYDANFKFPLSSSRKLPKILTPEECIACRPTLITDPDPDPEPTCVELNHSGGSGNNRYIYSGDITNLPSNFAWGTDFEVDYGEGYPTLTFIYNFAEDYYELASPGDAINGSASGSGFIIQNTEAGNINICVNWSIPAGV